MVRWEPLSRRKTSLKILVGRSTKVARVFGTYQARGCRGPPDSGGGADVIETDTFGAASCCGYDLADQAYSLNKTAAQLAKRVAAEFPREPDLSLGQWGQRRNCQRWDALTDDEGVLRGQATGLYDGGVDLFIVETCQDVLQIRQR